MSTSHPCEFEGCDFKSTNKVKLKTHIVSHSSNIQNCPEEDCDKQFTNVKGLNLHVRKIHKKEDNLPDQENINANVSLPIVNRPRKGGNINNSLKKANDKLPPFSPNVKTSTPILHKKESKIPTKKKTSEAEHLLRNLPHLNVKKSVSNPAETVAGNADGASAQVEEEKSTVNTVNVVKAKSDVPEDLDVKIKFKKRSKMPKLKNDMESSVKEHPTPNFKNDARSSLTKLKDPSHSVKRQKESNPPPSKQSKIKEQIVAEPIAKVAKKPRKIKEKFILNPKVSGKQKKKVDKDHCKSQKLTISSEPKKKYKIPCHCVKCQPCRGPCCDNPAVRAGKCCDPNTLGRCLQPFEAQCYAPCCETGVQLKDHFNWNPTNGNIIYNQPLKLDIPLHFDRDLVNADNYEDFKEYAEETLVTHMKNEASKFSFSGSKTVYCEPATLFAEDSDGEFEYFPRPAQDLEVFENIYDILATDYVDDDDEMQMNDTWYEVDRDYDEGVEIQSVKEIASEIRDDIAQNGLGYIDNYCDFDILNNNGSVNDVKNDFTSLNPDDDHKIYNNSSLPPGCQIVYKRFGDKMEMLYRTSQGQTFGNKEEFLSSIDQETGEVSQQRSSLYLNYLKPVHLRKIQDSKRIELREMVHQGEQNEPSTQAYSSLPSNPDQNEPSTSKSKPSKRKNLKHSKRTGSTSKVVKHGDSLASSPLLNQDREDIGGGHEVPKAATNSNDEINGELETFVCHPCKKQSFPLRDLLKHKDQVHSHELKALRTCDLCNNNELMKMHHLQKHRKEKHDGEVFKKGRPKKEVIKSNHQALNDDISFTSQASTDELDDSSIGVGNISMDTSTINDEILDNSLNSSAETVDKISDFLSQTVPLQTDDVDVPKKGGRSKKPEAKQRSRSLGGAMKATPKKAKKSPRKNWTKKPKQASKSKVLAPVLSDNDPNHPTSSGNLRKKGRHVHDQSMDCSSCSLSPREKLPNAREYETEVIKDSVKKTKGKKRGQDPVVEEDKIISISAKKLK